ncbi:hypothetical protein EDC90_10581, partial [Martelella mediterranea]
RPSQLRRQHVQDNPQNRQPLKSPDETAWAITTNMTSTTGTTLCTFEGVLYMFFEPRLGYLVYSTFTGEQWSDSSEVNINTDKSPGATVDVNFGQMWLFYKWSGTYLSGTAYCGSDVRWSAQDLLHLPQTSHSPDLCNTSRGLRAVWTDQTSSTVYTNILTSPL